VYHYCYIFVVDAVVVDRWFEEVGVLFEPVGLLDRFSLDFGKVCKPFWDIQWSGKHFGLFSDG
jgi:hypothetical protein